MPTKIISKKSSIAASVPIASDLEVGEIAVNTADKRQYTKHTDNSILELGINPSSVSTGSLSVGGVAITATPAEINKLDGFTGDVNDLNKLDAVTATATELNLLDGVTSTTAELNILDGVTSTATEINKLDGFTGSVSDLNKVATVTASAVELNLLDGVTATTAELNTLDGITATAATLNGLDTRVTSNNGDITTLQGRATDLETFEATAGTAYTKNVTVSSTDTTANRLTKVGDFGVGGISSTALTNANSPIIGSFQSSGALTESTAVTANFPSLGVSGSTPVWWNIFTYGGANTRLSQEATEVFAITGGALFNVPRKFIRNQQDSNWDAWVEVWHSGNLVKTTSSTDTTAGSMLKVGDFGVGAHLFSSGGNIGIGTTTPSEKLTVNGNIRVTQDINMLDGKSLKFNASSFITPENGVSGAEVSSAGAFTVKTGSSPSERMRINSVGNVGIGTTAPDSKLSVASTSGALVSRFQGTVSNGCLIGIDQSTLANWRFGQPAGQNAFAFYGFGGGSHPEFMRIDGSGNVGIGTTSPSNNIQIKTATNGGGLTLQRDSITEGDYSQLSFVPSTNDASEVRGWIRGHRGSSSTNTYLTFGTDNAERMRIDSTGNVLIGTTTPFGDGATTMSSLGVLFSSRLNANPLGLKRTGSDGSLAIFQRDNTAVGSISVTASATSYNTSSDKRLKENIVGSQSASSDIDAVQVRQFDWKADSKHQEYGFIAQELKEVAPYAVYTPEDADEMQSVDYSKLVPMMMKELQELRKRVLTLENK